MQHLYMARTDDTQCGQYPPAQGFMIPLRCRREPRCGSACGPTAKSSWSPCPPASRLISVSRQCAEHNFTFAAWLDFRSKVTTKLGNALRGASCFAGWFVMFVADGVDKASDSMRWNGHYVKLGTDSPSRPPSIVRST